MTPQIPKEQNLDAELLDGKAHASLMHNEAERIDSQSHKELFRRIESKDKPKETNFGFDRLLLDNFKYGGKNSQSNSRNKLQ